jgi:hypothetical protein
MLSWSDWGVFECTMQSIQIQQDQTLNQSDDGEVQTYVTYGGPSHFKMNVAFCARMRMALAAGLENAPIGVVTTPGTKKPRYVPTEPRPLASSRRDLEHA